MQGESGGSAGGASFGGGSIFSFSFPSGNPFFPKQTKTKPVYMCINIPPGWKWRERSAPPRRWDAVGLSEGVALPGGAEVVSN